MGDQPDEVYDRLLTAEGELREQLANVTDERDRLQALIDELPVIVEQAVRELQRTVGGDLAADPDTISDAVTVTFTKAREAADG